MGVDSSRGGIIGFFVRMHQAYLDRLSSYVFIRWFYISFMTFIFWHHVIEYGMHYVVAYMYAVYLLNLLIRFITPLDFDDLCKAHEAEHGGTILPSNENKTANITLERMKNRENIYEFRPFLRQMNEFTFWLSATRATHAALFCSMFEFLDVPVFWPLLVFYFVLLFATTMREQLRNMIKYKYIPFDFGKKSYGTITRQRK
ncbi:Rer1 family protein, putative [Babesia bigemina]|uniref:Protein RER1 n=1 Tax=Babesia bigemina TaxID=5866 RepID=A0A061DBY9_BABBI|nr:Rer1 family protein, putative [Babesia bigemina]CDR96409.1 Rer1 family protein, putative [Babesia bigemina]|eukprot:XP_012768595.1 Rer1 family protein, putative [Babesia bigemina]